MSNMTCSENEETCETMVFNVTNGVVDFNGAFLRGTLSVKFGIYMRQTTILGGGVLDNCPTYFLSPYYYLFFKYIHIKATLY